MAKIGYARISKDKQKMDLQIDILNQAGCSEIFKDMGQSGAKESRPGLDTCLKSLKEGDVLVVYKLDRLGRSLSHVMSLVEFFKEKGIQFQSITEGFDTTTPAGELLFHVIGALAQFERSLLKERINDGLDAARAKGIKLGRKESIPDEDRMKAIEMNRAGSTFAEICSTLGMSRASAHRIVRKHMEKGN